MRVALKPEDRRDRKITIRVNKNEENRLKENSTNHGLKIPGYLRSLGLNYPIKSIVDENAASNLLKVNGDLGRLGGLFKLWLSDNSYDKFDFSSKRSYKNIDDLVDEIEKLQKVLKSEALKIMQKQT
jgi:hypothetical protein